MSAAPYPTSPASAVDPGRTLGIIGLVLSIVTSLPGLIVSIIAHRKSKKAGFSNVFAKVGIAIGAIFTALWLGLSAVGVVGLVHVAQQCKDLGPGTHQVGSTTYTCG